MWLKDSARTDCCDSERKEFGTQTLHPVKSTVPKKLDKEISCKTPDLRPPPKYRKLIYSLLLYLLHWVPLSTIKIQCRRHSRSLNFETIRIL
jgi:hypothetical protein